ncbi:hypothetical protein BU14_2337s0002 [Porphyra umbilicalis]|uniref:Uncharacterized protein n=1 Tax=Porphyra umbilicalis TaxID=2786 RepID=A0A1X6NJC7_PORUM|nr:hypothetical protein BU14_2337s0002 [Porphyra umbilicalis]|eukprot:OSX68719.1 hypothetical protein BU14_2337s0002 [Porphyra umbilicalis]
MGVRVRRWAATAFTGLVATAATAAVAVSAAPSNGRPPSAGAVRQAAPSTSAGVASALGAPCDDVFSVDGATGLACLFINTISFGSEGRPTVVLTDSVPVGGTCSPRHLNACTADTTYALCIAGTCMRLADAPPPGAGRRAVGDECIQARDCATGVCARAAWTGLRSVCSVADVPAGGDCHWLAACGAGLACATAADAADDAVLGPVGVCRPGAGPACPTPCDAASAACGVQAADADGCGRQRLPAGAACGGDGAGGCAAGLVCSAAVEGAGFPVCHRPNGGGGGKAAAPSAALSTWSPADAAADPPPPCVSNVGCPPRTRCRWARGSAAPAGRACRRAARPGAPCDAPDVACGGGHQCDAPAGGGAPKCVRWAKPGEPCNGAAVAGCWNGFKCRSGRCVAR